MIDESLKRIRWKSDLVHIGKIYTVFSVIFFQMGRSDISHVLSRVSSLIQFDVDMSNVLSFL